MSVILEASGVRSSPGPRGASEPQNGWGGAARPVRGFLMSLSSGPGRGCPRTNAEPVQGPSCGGCGSWLSLRNTPLANSAETPQLPGAAEEGDGAPRRRSYSVWGSAHFHRGISGKSHHRAEFGAPLCFLGNEIGSVKCL